MNILIAPNSMKGSLDCRAVAEQWRRVSVRPPRFLI